MIVLAWISIAFGLLGIIYPIIKRNVIIARGQKPLPAILGGAFFLIIGISVLFLYEPEEKEKVLTLNELVALYTENAKAINAKYDFDWTLEKGEKADIIKLILNDSVQWSITTQKNENKTVIGSVLFITTPEEKKQEEALLSLYAMIKTYEPNLADAVIKNFVANFINQKDSDTYKSQNIIYTKKSLGNTFMLFIRYENLNDDI